MTNLALAQVLKAEIQRCAERISADTRRKNILTHYATRLRLGKSQEVVLAELAAAGEPIDLQEAE
jgi:hypothetical protein